MLRKISSRLRRGFASRPAPSEMLYVYRVLSVFLRQNTTPTTGRSSQQFSFGFNS